MAELVRQDAPEDASHQLLPESVRQARHALVRHGRLVNQPANRIHREFDRALGGDISIQKDHGTEARDMRR